MNSYLIAAVIWLAVILSLSISKSLGFPEVSDWLEHQLGGDLAMHIFWASGLSFLSCKSFPALSYKACPGLLSPVVLILTAGCLVEELSQLYLPNRAFSWLDFSASCFGVVFGCLLARIRYKTLN